MSYNVPTIDTTRLSFGPGILYMGAPGTTPTVDVGAVTGDTDVTIERKKIQVKAGSPQSLVAEYAIEEDISIKMKGMEWKLDNMAYVLGAGVTSVSGAQEILEFGGDMAFTNRALRFVHIAADGSTIDLHIFKAEGSGKLTINMKEKDMHEVGIEFVSLEGTVDFTNGALASNKKKFKIIRTKK
jgi:hypothetical protein